MQVPYEVKDCEYGRGLFAAGPITKGQMVWSIHAADVELIEGTEAQQEWVRAREADGTLKAKHLEYIYFTIGGCLAVISEDDGRFFNHDALNRNVGVGAVPVVAAAVRAKAAAAAMRLKAEGKAAAAEAAARAAVDVDPECAYAVRDIAAGEELLDDYGSFGEEPEWFFALFAKYNIDTSYYDGSAVGVKAPTPAGGAASEPA